MSLCVCETVSLLDSLDSTLDNEKRPHGGVQITSADMQTIPELTGEAATNTRGNSVDTGLVDQDNRVTNDSGRRLSNTEAGFTQSADRRPSNTQRHVTS